MKIKFIIFIAILIFPMLLSATPMNVVGEVFTATTCHYCPSARAGIRDLAANFENFIPLIWQSPTGYVGEESPNYNNRFQMYNGSGLPLAMFGGTIRHGGGIGTGSMYETYLPYYYTLDSLESPLALDISMEVNNRSTVDIEVQVEVTGNISTTDNKLVMLVTNRVNDEYSCSVVRYYETDFDLTTIGETETYNYSFDYNSSWHILDVRSIGLVQSFSGDHNILQAAICGVDSLVPMFTSNVQAGPADLLVAFTNESYPSTGITSFKWDFNGDGVWDSYEENPTYRYDTPGNYNVTLQVFKDADSASVVVEDYITVTSSSNIFGELSGIWTENHSPYIITGDVHISDGNVLEIEPNTEIHVNNGSSFVVEGQLVAAGAEDEYVVFTTDDVWKGFQFYNSLYPNIISYTSITGCTKCAIDIESSLVEISNNMIYENTTSFQEGAAIHILDSDDVLLEWNVIANNSSSSLCGAISIDASSPTIHHNIIVNNEADYAGAFVLRNASSPIMDHNTIANNLSSNAAICLFTNSNPTVVNSIIRNTDQVFMNFSSIPVVTYSDISGGYTGTGNIAGDPLFVAPTEGDGPLYDGLNADWHLQEESPCIDAGDPSSPHDPDSTITDMGALYYNQVHGIDDHDIQMIGTYNYPNPFSAETTIRFSPKSGLNRNYKALIYNIKGELVQTLDLEAGASSYYTTWDGKDNLGRSVSNGIYFYKIKSDDGNHIQKIMLMK